MYKRKLKPFVLPSVYIIIVAFFITSILLLGNAIKPDLSKDVTDDYDYVKKDIIEKNIPVVGSEKLIIRPYNDSEVKILRYFYNYQAEAQNQEKALIYYENTYIQNSGVDYGGVDIFNVVAILDGTIINVNEDNLLGKVIEIRHTNDFISVYQCLSEIEVKKADTVVQGQIIGKSGTCNISLDLKNHLHFEILFKGKVVDPETFYDKSIKDL